MQQNIDPEAEALAQQMFGLPEEDDTAEPSEQPEATTEEPTEDVASLLARLKQLEQRVGTDEDVSVLKSQRDKAKNEAEQLRPILESLQAQVQTIAQQRTQDDDTAFHQAWQQYVAAQPDKRLAQAQYDLAYQKRAQDRREAVLQEREMAMRQTAEQAQTSALIQKTIGIFADQARLVGISPSELDVSSEDALKDSFAKALEKKQRLDANPPRQPGHKPQRGGAPAPAKDMKGWFSNHAGRGEWNAINQAFDAAENIRGIDWQEIVRR